MFLPRVNVLVAIASTTRRTFEMCDDDVDVDDDHDDGDVDVDAEVHAIGIIRSTE